MGHVKREEQLLSSLLPVLALLISVEPNLPLAPQPLPARRQKDGFELAHGLIALDSLLLARLHFHLRLHLVLDGRVTGDFHVNLISVGLTHHFHGNHRTLVFDTTGLNSLIADLLPRCKQCPLVASTHQQIRRVVAHDSNYLEHLALRFEHGNHLSFLRQIAKFDHYRTSISCSNHECQH